MAHYFDTSALVKFIVEERESAALRGFLHTDVTPISSDLSRTELMRAVRRAAPDRMQDVRAVLDGLILMELTTATFESAGRLNPEGLRSLDALHLAAALSLGDDLEAVVTYDDRLAESARLQGLRVLAPGPGRS